jgi:hypothetical protein
MSGNDAFDQALSAAVAQLADGAVVTVAEFGTEGVVFWEIRRDGNGTPQARQRPPSPSPTKEDPKDPDGQRPDPLPEISSQLFIVCSTADERPHDVFDALRDAHRDAPVFSCSRPVAEHLRGAIKDSALTRWYELVVLRRTRSGKLGMDGHPLFPPGAQRGYSQQFRISCEPSDSSGTVFAVVTRHGRQFQIVSLQSGDVPPGRYEPTAVLDRPGRVVFDGLPTTLRPDSRPWPTIVQNIPERLDQVPPAHLVCLIEVSCSTKRLEHRIDRLEQLITSADQGNAQLAVSLVTYGPHAFDHREHDEPASVLAWGVCTDQALDTLRQVRKRKPPEDEYPWAAQLECALDAVAARLTVDDGRPVVVTVGSRPPHPARMDIRTEILPCPKRNNWRWPLGRLKAMPGIAFGALRDEGKSEVLWAQLSRDARQPLDVVDVAGFAADVGLCPTLRYVPLPLSEEGSLRAEHCDVGCAKQRENDIPGRTEYCTHRAGHGLGSGPRQRELRGQAD